MRLLLILLFCNYVNAQTLCDSLSYSIGDTNVITLIGFNNSSDSVNFMWSVCDDLVCYSANGDTAYFPLASVFDTVKVCYDISPQWTCSDCQYVALIQGSWQEVSVVTRVNEIKSLPVNNKIYDLLGRELNYIPKGVYIKNGMIFNN